MMAKESVEKITFTTTISDLKDNFKISLTKRDFDTFAKLKPAFETLLEIICLGKPVCAVDRETLETFKSDQLYYDTFKYSSDRYDDVSAMKDIRLINLIIHIYKMLPHKDVDVIDFLYIKEDKMLDILTKLTRLAKFVRQTSDVVKPVLRSFNEKIKEEKSKLVEIDKKCENFGIDEDFKRLVAENQALQESCAKLREKRDDKLHSLTDLQVKETGIQSEIVDMKSFMTACRKEAEDLAYKIGKYERYKASDPEITQKRLNVLEVELNGIRNKLTESHEIHLKLHKQNDGLRNNFEPNRSQILKTITDWSGISKKYENTLKENAELDANVPPQSINELTEKARNVEMTYLELMKRKDVIIGQRLEKEEMFEQISSLTIEAKTAEEKSSLKLNQQQQEKLDLSQQKENKENLYKTMSSEHSEKMSNLKSTTISTVDDILKYRKNNIS